MITNKTLLLSISLLLYSVAVAQKNKNEVWAGVEYNLHLKHEFNKTNGPGISLKDVYAFSNRFDGVISLGYNYFKGEVKYWDGKTEDHFALMPLLLGSRYNFNKLFLGFEAGAVIKASKNAGTLLTIVPSFGYTTNKFSTELRLLQVPGMPSFPENSFLKKGGYNFLGLRLSYPLF